MVSNTERTCKTCRHYPPEGKKWPCIDCTMSMNNIYDRWEPEEEECCEQAKAHGWIMNENGLPVCSECGRTPYCDHGGHLLKSPFCPSCGAPMM